MPMVKTFIACLIRCKSLKSLGDTSTNLLFRYQLSNDG